MKRYVSFLEGIMMIVIGIIVWNLILVFFNASETKKEDKMVETDKTTIIINGCEYTLTHKGNCKNHK